MSLISSRSADMASADAAVALSSLIETPRRRSGRVARTSWIAAVLLMCSAASFADEGGKLFAACVACHGNRGEGSAALNAPAIAGQDAAYLERQLRHFRSGRRGTHKSDSFGAQMRAAVATLPDDGAASKVASYIAKLPKTVTAAPLQGNLRNGNNLYQGKCGACHGSAAEGNTALNSPRLAGLDAAYLKRQFAYFRDGVRGTDPQDVPGRQMAMMAKTVPAERDLDDIIAFIHTQGRPK
jgi:cytochrome c553